MAYGSELNETSNRMTKIYVWSHLVLADNTDADGLLGMMFEIMAEGSREELTDAQLATAETLLQQWSELFATGLPGVTEEHLRTLTVPR